MKTSLHTGMLAITALASAALLAACGGGGGDSGTPAANLATVTSTAVAAAKYSQSMLVTIQGTNLDASLAVSSAGCKSMTRSTTGTTVSTATTAYYTCTVSAVGAQTVVVTRSDGQAMTGASYTIEVPQVTLTVSNGAGVNGNLVITLEPAKAPLTTDNFLAYVQSGFYVGTAYHRAVSGFVVQGGGYAAPITATATPAAKATNAAITLEDGAGLSNLKYTIAMARTNVADSATSQFFINLASNTFLDKAGTARGYAVFGTVTTGTAVVDAMAVAPCTAAAYSECVPIPNITITAATQTR